jgi:serine/threonine protein kinase
MVAGTQVGAYRVLQQIGAGGMGEVWMAEHTILGRRAAIKVLHPGHSRQPEIVARFFNEARAATAIADPGIVQIFDFGHHEGSAYIAMELLQGEPLDKRLARVGALALGDALRITRQVASSLAAAHARGIVHRDLKPENIFLVIDAEVVGGERAKILDFGIAKLGGDSGGVKTQTSALMGTPTFMSPEQCRGAGMVDQRSDIYSLGCVLFMLMVGRPPFESEGAGELIAMHLREAPPSVSSRAPGVPPEVDALVARCLAKDPAQRYFAAGDLAAALTALLARFPGSASVRAAAIDRAERGPASQEATGGGSTMHMQDRASVGPENAPPRADTGGGAGRTMQLADSRSAPPGESRSAHPTTLASAAREASTTQLPARRVPRAAVIGGGVLVIGLVAVMVLRGGSPGGPSPTPTPTPTPMSTLTPTPSVAAPVVATAPALPAFEPDGGVAGVTAGGAVAGQDKPAAPASASKAHASSKRSTAPAAKSVAARPYKAMGGADDDIPDKR